MAVKAGKEVVEALNEILTAELTAVNQYFLHAKMMENWGYMRLYEKIYRESIDEMKHADQLIERILYLDGVPNVQRLARIRIGENPKEILESDLQLELEAIPRLNQTITFVRDQVDNGTRNLLESILVSEEEHLDWIESQLHMMDEVGVQQYLAEQIRA
ncbi:MAG: bacterioferritin [Myxococcota bacterium]